MDAAIKIENLTKALAEQLANCRDANGRAATDPLAQEALIQLSAAIITKATPDERRELEACLAGRTDAG